MRIIAVDPGTSESAFCIYKQGAAIVAAKVTNSEILHNARKEWNYLTESLLAVEGIASYGMSVGKEIFDTCILIGRLIEAWDARGGKWRLVYRKEVKLFHCETVKANDSNIRAALIDRFGPGKDIAIGTKKNPGPLYGIKGDEWSALAIALTVAGAPVAPPLFRDPPAPRAPLDYGKEPF